MASMVRGLWLLLSAQGNAYVRLSVAEGKFGRVDVAKLMFAEYAGVGDARGADVAHAGNAAIVVRQAPVGVVV
eukprot:6720624-Lingulodinium_polyedra.AAC.1